MIISDINIPIDVDVNNPDDLKSFLIAMKQSIESIALKGQQTQEQVRSDAPDATEIQEGELVPSLETGTYKLYRMIEGAIKSVTMT